MHQCLLWCVPKIVASVQQLIGGKPQHGIQRGGAGKGHKLGSLRANGEASVPLLASLLNQPWRLPFPP